MHPRLVECIRGKRGWLIPAAFLALAPKCFLCVLAYAGLGTALGFGGPELCGSTIGLTENQTWLPLLPGIILGIAGFRRCRSRATRLDG